MYVNFFQFLKYFFPVAKLFSGKIQKIHNIGENGDNSDVSARKLKNLTRLRRNINALNGFQAASELDLRLAIPFC